MIIHGFESHLATLFLGKYECLGTKYSLYLISNSASEKNLAEGMCLHVQKWQMSCADVWDRCADALN